MTNRELKSLYRLKTRIAQKRKLLSVGRGGGSLRMELEREVREAERLEAYIAGIEDAQTRAIFEYRYAMGYSWTKVALSVGGGNTAEGVRKICDRKLRRGRTT